MNREIKFRAWVYNAQQQKNEMINDILSVYPKFGYSSEQGLHVLEWLEYTGMRDKNNKDIFEGDLVKRHGLFDDGIYNFTVYYDINTCSFRLYSLDSPFIYELVAGENYEVVGNIYENPDLIKEEEGKKDVDS